MASADVSQSSKRKRDNDDSLKRTKKQRSATSHLPAQTGKSSANGTQLQASDSTRNQGLNHRQSPSKERYHRQNPESIARPKERPPSLLENGHSKGQNSQQSPQNLLPPTQSNEGRKARAKDKKERRKERKHEKANHGRTPHSRKPPPGRATAEPVISKESDLEDGRSQSRDEENAAKKKLESQQTKEGKSKNQKDDQGALQNLRPPEPSGEVVDLTSQEALGDDRKSHAIKSIEPRSKPAAELPLCDRKHAPVQSADRKSKTSWNTSKSSGGKLLDISPIFSRDEEHLICASITAVEVYSTRDSVLEHSLPVDPADMVTSMTLSAADPDTLYIGTKKGYILSFCWPDGKRNGRWLTDAKIVDLVTGRDSETVDETLLTIDASKRWRITAHRLGSKDSTHKAELSTILKLKKPIRTLKVTQGCRVIVAITLDSILIGHRARSPAASLKDLKYIWREVQCHEPLVCFDVRQETIFSNASPENPTIDLAVGDIHGCIYIYQNILHTLKGSTARPGEPVDPATAKVGRELHWHRQSVGGLAWSLDGMSFALKWL